MRNSDTKVGWEYHNSTKHSNWSIRRDAHFLDWENQPAPYKQFPSGNPVPLPRDFPPLEMSALDAVSGQSLPVTGDRMPALPEIASILFHSAGVTKKRVYPGGEFHFRAAACAGALYPIEIYLVSGGLPGLEAGVYHFHPGEGALRVLRQGDYLRVLREATGGQSAISTAPLVLVVTAMTWRSAWKYQARSYRYHFWDSGMILAHILATCFALGLPTSVVMGFVDDTVNHLVGVDGTREMTLALIPVGCRSRTSLGRSSEVPVLDLEVTPLSRNEVEYPLIQQMHAASKLETADEVASWRSSCSDWLSDQALEHPEPEIPLPIPAGSAESLTSVILKRGSTRRFARRPVSIEFLSAVMDRSTSTIPGDCLSPEEERLNDLYITVHAVDGLPPGAYHFCQVTRSLELLKEGDFRRQSSYLCLEQSLGGDSSFTVFFLSDLARIFRAYGNRGYRAAQMEAGIIGGRMYLSAYALGRGATGLTFYDDDVTEFFSPHARGKSAIFVMAVGVPGRRSRL